MYPFAEMLEPELSSSAWYSTFCVADARLSDGRPSYSDCSGFPAGYSQKIYYTRSFYL